MINLLLLADNSSIILEITPGNESYHLYMEEGAASRSVC